MSIVWMAKMPDRPVRTTNYHTFEDCGVLEGRREEGTPGDANQCTYVPVAIDTAKMLGFDECTVCERRRKHGPALMAAVSDSLDSVFSEAGVAMTANDALVETFVRHLRNYGYSIIPRGKQQ